MLSKRLSKALSFVDQTDTFYDLCCDHGYLGKAVYEANLANELVFNDQVPQIIDKLKDSLSAYITIPVKFEVKSCTKIKFSNNSTISILGVGCNTIFKLLENLNGKHNLIISSHTRPLLLRRKLQDLKYKLIDEALIKENGKFYEILKLSTYETGLVPQIGNFALDEDYKEYLAKLSKYYQNKVTHENNSISKEILKIIRSKQKEFQ